MSPRRFSGRQFGLFGACPDRKFCAVHVRCHSRQPDRKPPAVCGSAPVGRTKFADARVCKGAHQQEPLATTTKRVIKLHFMQVRVNVPDRLAAEAQARGVSLEMYVEEMLAQQIIGPEGETLHESVSEAIDRIRELRKQNRLGGLKTKDLIHEGHKY
jgi:hypothetical protein